MILNNIKAAQLEARKSGDTKLRGSLTILISECEAIGKKNLRTATDDEVVAVIKSFIKKIDQSIEMIGDKADVSELLEEKSVYESFLPTQMTEEDIFHVLQNAIECGYASTNIGSLMAFMKSTYSPSSYDGKLVSTIARNLC